MNHIIELKNIYHRYNQKEVLKGISLTVEKGEIIGLLGPSGAGAGVMCLAGGYTGLNAVRFLLILAAGILTSIIIGAAIGAFSKNQMVATSIMTPVMMIFAFVPMIGGFNEHVQKVSKLLYSGQIDYLIGNIGNAKLQTSSLLIILINAIIALILFTLAYRNLRKV